MHHTWIIEKRSRYDVLCSVLGKFVSSGAIAYQAAMIDKSSALQVIQQKVDKLEVGHALDLRTYKRNRSVVIVKRSKQRFTVLEGGYETNRFEIDGKELRKLLKTLLKREFPRSNKIRVYQLGPFDETLHWDMQRKIL